MTQVQAHHRARVQMDKVNHVDDRDACSNVREQEQQPTLTPFINVKLIPPIIYTLLSDWTRLHKIDIPNTVVWEEASFGRIASHYLNRQYFIASSNPPLGTILIGLAALLSGYDGNFDFTLNEVYPDNIPYAPMRGKLAIFGVLLVPLAWFTAVELGMSTWVCHLTTIMILCEVSFLMISRFISIDSIYLFFTFLTVFCFAKFHNQQSRSFSKDWWLWLTMTGISIGCVTSVKLSGFSVAALVWVCTIEDLWRSKLRFLDSQLSVRKKLKQWFARIICLIILPILIFVSTFKIHFLILNSNHSESEFVGPRDGDFMRLLINTKFTLNTLRLDTLISEFMHRYKPEPSDIVYLGVRMFRLSDGDNPQPGAVLLGTSIIWWGSGLSLVVGLGTYWYYLLMIQPGEFKLPATATATVTAITSGTPKSKKKDLVLDSVSDYGDVVLDPESERWLHFKYVWKIAFYGWLFHFVPLLTTKKETIYMNEYLPSLYFSILMLSLMFDHFIFSSKSSFPKRLRNPVFGAIVGLLPMAFWDSWNMALT